LHSPQLVTNSEIDLRSSQLYSPNALSIGSSPGQKMHWLLYQKDISKISRWMPREKLERVSNNIWVTAITWLMMSVKFISRE
jgi:hypothetical protein